MVSTISKSICILLTSFLQSSKLGGGGGGSEHSIPNMAQAFSTSSSTTPTHTLSSASTIGECSSPLCPSSRITISPLHVSSSPPSLDVPLNSHELNGGHGIEIQKVKQPSNLRSPPTSMTMAARKERILPKRPALKLVATNKHFQKPTSTTKTSSTRTQHTRKPFPGVVPIKASASSPASIRLTREQETKYTAEIRVLKSAIRTRDDLAAANHDREHDSSSSSSNNSRSSSNNNKNQQQHTNNNPLAKALKYQIGPSEEEWAKQCNLTPLGLRKVLIRGREARKHLVAANVGLVMQISRKYANELKRSIDLGESNGVGTILTLQDMIQEGNLGIMEAAERFDPKKGARFGTYASYWIKQRILRSIADNSRTIRLPAHVHSTLRTIRRARHDLQKEIGRAPSMPELAHHLGMPIEKIQLYTDSSRSVLSLESPISKNGKGSKAGTGDVDKRSLGDRIASDSPTPEEMSELDALRIDIRKVIDGLGNDRERDVLLCRFGLEDGNPRTLQETAQHLGISRERVRMVEARALNKLRHPQRNYRLKDYVGEHHHVEEDDPMRIFKQQNFQDPQGYPEGLSPEKMWSF